MGRTLSDLSFEAAMNQAESALVRAGLTVLESSLLGAIALLSIGISAWAVWKLSGVQDQRARDLERSNERMEVLITKMTATFADVGNSLDNLTAAEKDAQELLQGMKNSLDTVVMEAIRRLGASSYGAQAAPEPPRVPRRP